MSRSVIWFHKDPSQGNQFCLYCGIYVGFGSSVISNEEHLIGRNFVPKGTMENHFNFSFRACEECNTRKSKLEDHISSLTLLDTPSVATNPLARNAAERKANGSFHPEKRVRMKDAREREEVEFSFGGATFKFGMTGPPRPAEDYIPRLAYHHVQGLFSLVSKPEGALEGQLRILPPDQFRFFGHYVHSDWGNPQLNEITQRVANVPCVAAIISGAGHFRACLRCSPGGGWFWALEWNKSLRLVGAIQHPSASCSWFEDLPLLDWRSLPNGSRIRTEVAEPDLGASLFPLGLVPPPGDEDFVQSAFS